MARRTPSRLASSPTARRSAWIQWLCGSPWEAPRLYAALVHDFLCSGGDQEATRADADDIFRDLQISLGVPRWKAYVEWAALRLFGGSHWQGEKEEGEPG